MNKKIKKYLSNTIWNHVEFIGKYNDYDVYSLEKLDKNGLPIIQFVGYPHYLFVKDQKMEIKVDINFEITNHFYKYDEDTEELKSFDE
ncbi:hypothetical protein [Streptobacillus moniliformis]|uniref:hypothetical protein n=1 Tax=Streptobacillus moniliformis TaxID=34105 RepID=UPI0007E324DC|nr:hypothetical protein [Streptobacillus moniliformis]